MGNRLSQQSNQTTYVIKDDNMCDEEIDTKSILYMNFPICARCGRLVHMLIPHDIYYMGDMTKVAHAVFCCDYCKRLIDVSVVCKDGTSDICRVYWALLAQQFGSSRSIKTAIEKYKSQPMWD